MAGPIVFISHFAVKEGKVDAIRQLAHDVTQRLDVEKPRTLAYGGYLAEDGAQVSFIHVFGDASSMDEHFEGAEERSRAAYELVEPRGWEIWGEPSHAALETMRRAASAAGVSLVHYPDDMAGFLRLGSG
jgi:hypothetical protein